MSEKDWMKYCIIHLYMESKKHQTHRNRVEWWFDYFSFLLYMETRFRSTKKWSENSHIPYTQFPLWYLMLAWMCATINEAVLIFYAHLKSVLYPDFLNVYPICISSVPGSHPGCGSLLSCHVTSNSYWMWWSQTFPYFWRSLPFWGVLSVHYASGIFQNVSQLELWWFP